MAKKQLHIAGTEPESIKEIDDAVEKYVEIRDARMKLTDEEIAARDVLVGAMQSKGLVSYSALGGDFEVTLASVTRPKVKRAKSDDGTGTGDDAAE